MTIRHKARVLAVSGALLTSGFALAPVAMSSVAAQSPVIRNDVLSGVAARALADLTTFQSSGSSSARVAYDSGRHELAVVLASRLSVDATALEATWQAADAPHQLALMGALSQLGVPYRRLASSPGVGFDCSGLTAYAWSQAGVSLPHQSARQIRSIAARTADTAEAGDIVYYPGHAMMYLGLPGTIVHAPYSGRTIEVDFISKGHRSVRYGDPTG
jgi:cell wall-associated NlpC family hydrolase